MSKSLSKKSVPHKRIVVLTICATLVVSLLGIFSYYICGNVSKYYLGKAENTVSNEDKLTNLEMAYLFRPSNIVAEKVGFLAYDLKDYDLAIKYLEKSNSETSYNGLVKAYYVMEEYDKVLALTEHYNDNNNDLIPLRIKAFLKKGDLLSAESSFVEINMTNNLPEILKYRFLFGIDKDCNLQIADESFCSLDESVMRTEFAYNVLIDDGYPQSAYELVKKVNGQTNTSRNALLVLAESQIVKRDYENAYSTLLEALKRDLYYPQTYRQLILVTEKLGKTDEGKQYQESLNAMIF